MTRPTDKLIVDAGFNYGKAEGCNVFLQWKGTDACFDFNCECGAGAHFDGDFAYTVKCGNCGTVWEMPFVLFPRKANEETGEYWRENPKELEMDEDHPNKDTEPKLYAFGSITTTQGDMRDPGAWEMTKSNPAQNPEITYQTSHDPLREKWEDLSPKDTNNG